MKLRLSTFAAPETVVILAVLAGCGQDDPGPTNIGGLPDAGGTGATGGLDAGGSKCAAGSPGGATGGSTGGTGGGIGGTIPATFETVKLILGGGGGVMPCAAAPCHGVNGAAPPEHPLELPPTDDQRLHTNLLTYVSKACNNTKLVDPCNPARSALVTILKGQCGMTPRMPYGCSPQAGDCIPDEYIAALSQWIANGAARP